MKRRKQRETASTIAPRVESSRKTAQPMENGKTALRRSASGLEPPDLTRVASSSSISHRSARLPDEVSKPDEKFTMVPTRDAAEMKRRASANKTFVKVVFGATSIVLSYKVSAILGEPR